MNHRFKTQIGWRSKNLNETYWKLDNWSVFKTLGPKEKKISGKFLVDFKKFYWKTKLNQSEAFITFDQKLPQMQQFFRGEQFCPHLPFFSSSFFFLQTMVNTLKIKKFLLTSEIQKLSRKKQTSNSDFRLLCSDFKKNNCWHKLKKIFKNIYLLLKSRQMITHQHLSLPFRGRFLNNTGW